eukprot:4508712-Pyramimonas_sp.AAC.1
MDREITQFLTQELKQTPAGGAAFHEFLQRWKWPGGCAGGGKICAGNKYHTPKGTASELLSAAP